MPKPLCDTKLINEIIARLRRVNADKLLREFGLGIAEALRQADPTTLRSVVAILAQQLEERFGVRTASKRRRAARRS